jgi:hypothetical protein
VVEVVELGDREARLLQERPRPGHVTGRHEARIGHQEAPPEAQLRGQPPQLRQDPGPEDHTRARNVVEGPHGLLVPC